MLVTFFEFSGRQLPEAGKTTAEEDVAAKSPNEADGGRSDLCHNCHNVAYSLRRFHMRKW